MSLEKEPAGAFNKAQRLIERAQYTLHSQIRKEASRFVSASRLWCSDPSASRVSVELQARRYRLTALHESGHVDATKLYRCDKQIGSSEAATSVAATILKSRK
ncbi:hypothetical protein [Bradyrhizobium sp. DASA03007]|uniref:hypothetical protein n=1 Tax=unclassified Bradyrhizobium TaxID=2631580 RepID=UPI003F6F946A